MHILMKLAFLASTAVLSMAYGALASCNGTNAPTVTSISPSSGSVAGGTPVTIYGTSLGCVTVSFGSAAATNVTASSTSVTATSPAGVVGTVVVTVTNPPFGIATPGPFAGATATTLFSYIPTAGAPTNLLANARDGEVSVAFTAPANTGGSPITDYDYQVDGGIWVSAGTTESPVVIDGLMSGTSYTIAVRAVNAAGAGTASATVTIDTPSPQAALADAQDVVRDAIQDEAVRSLQSAISANQRQSREARGRYIAEQMREDSGAKQADVPFDVSGTLQASGATISSKGSFFGAQSMGVGMQRLLFGDFDIQRDGETGSSTATMTVRLAWEKLIDERTLLGYFIGGELAQSSIAGTFAGTHNRVGVTVGGYGVYELALNTYVDGFVTFGVGRNNLEMSDGILELDSDYTTRSITLGAALGSVIEQPGYEIWPELSFSYGRTWIGTVDFTGAYDDWVDNTLALDAGSVMLANVMFRPEVRVPLDGLASSESLHLFTFAPRLVCERITIPTTEETCGGGAEVGFTGRTDDGRSTYSASISADQLGSRTHSTMYLKLEHRF